VKLTTGTVKMQDSEWSGDGRIATGPDSTSAAGVRHGSAANTVGILVSRLSPQLPDSSAFSREH
jgi:hypothetical protein